MVDPIPNQTLESCQRLIEEMTEQVAQMLTLGNSIKDRLKKLENELNAKFLSDADDIHKPPFKAIDEIKRFQAEHSDEVHIATVDQVSASTGKDMQTCVFNQLLYILSPKFQHLHTCVEETNLEFQNSVLMKILFDATKKHYPDLKKAEFQSAVQYFLCYLS